MGNAFSIDLASKRYRNFGMALLKESSGPQMVRAADLGLKDPPHAGAFVAAVDRFCREHDVDVLLLDGPQGWRLPESPIEHMRLCERAFNTPGKTGVPGQVKPRTYLDYIAFSINVFQGLHFGHGWSLLQQDWARRRHKSLVVEVYPSVAWTLLGLERLPSKARARELANFRRALERVTGWTLPVRISHDELQAAVVLPLASALLKRREETVLVAGVDPIIKDGVIFEGLIASPRKKFGQK